MADGEKCNVCRLNDTWVDGRCTNPRCRSNEPVAFEAARLLRALAQARENLLVQCDQWDELAKGEFPLTVRIRELACLCTPDAPRHDHSKGGYR